MPEYLQVMRRADAAYHDVAQLHLHEFGAADDRDRRTPRGQVDATR